MKLHIDDLQRYLYENTDSRDVRDEARTIWSFLVRSHALRGVWGLPDDYELRIDCDECGRPYGVCRHNFSHVDEEHGFTVYNNERQLGHWLIERSTLTGSPVREALRVVRFPDLTQWHRDRLLGWIDSL